MHPSRRDLLKNAVVGTGLSLLTPSLSAMRPLSARPPGTRRLVVLFCYGGFDGLNMLVPVTNSAYYARRPGIAISPSTALPMVGTTAYGLHPSLQNLQAMYQQSNVAIVRKVGYPSENLSHFQSQDIYSYGVRDFNGLNIPRSGWISRYAAAYTQEPSDVVGIGVGRKKDLVGTSATPLIAKRLSDFKFQADNRYSRNHELRMELIRRRIDDVDGSVPADVTDALRQGHDFSDTIQAAVEAYEPAPGAVYPENRPGRELRDIATLIRAGFSTRVFLTGVGGWDTHGEQGNEVGRQADLLTRLDGALGAFATDLQAMQEWQDTVVLIVSEFGRRNFENSSGGTDHGHGNMMFVVGPNVQGGLYGPDLTELEIAEERYLGYDVDFRDVYREVVSGHLQVDPGPVFPEPQSQYASIDLFS